MFLFLCNIMPMSESMQKKKKKSKHQTSKVIWLNVKVKGRQQSKKMTARQTMGKKRTVSSSYLLTLVTLVDSVC